MSCASAAPPAHVAAAREWAEDRRGEVSFAVRYADGRLVGYRVRRTVPTASVLKPMLLAAYLDRARDRPLDRREKGTLAAMIRRSDNAAAERILAVVGTAGLRRVAHRVGMEHFKPIVPVWGASRTDAADQTRFFLHLERYLAPRHRAWAMTLLRTIVPSQRWGIGRLRLPGWRVYFKGGWGSGTGRVDHQVALLRGCGGARLSVAVMTEFDGTHAYGKATLEGVFRRLLRGSPRPLPAAPAQKSQGLPGLVPGSPRPLPAAPELRAARAGGRAHRPRRAGPARR